MLWGKPLASQGHVWGWAPTQGRPPTRDQGTRKKQAAAPSLTAGVERAHPCGERALGGAVRDAGRGVCRLAPRSRGTEVRWDPGRRQEGPARDPGRRLPDPTGQAPEPRSCAARQSQTRSRGPSLVGVATDGDHPNRGRVYNQVPHQAQRQLSWRLGPREAWNLLVCAELPTLVSTAGPTHLWKNAVTGRTLSPVPVTLRGSPTPPVSKAPGAGG